MKHADKNKSKTGVSAGATATADLGDGEAGLAARQLLSETITGQGAFFTDTAKGYNGGGKKGGKGKSKTPRQARGCCMRGGCDC